MRTALPPEAAASSATAAPQRMPLGVTKFSASSDQTVLGAAAEARAADPATPARMTTRETTRLCFMGAFDRHFTAAASLKPIPVHSVNHLTAASPPSPEPWRILWEPGPGVPHGAGD